VRDQVQEHSYDLEGPENFSAASLLEVLTANLDGGARVILESIGPDEQEALNELEALLLRFAVKKTPLGKRSFSCDDCNL
jgi:phosphotransferase system HPr-like phosphotransfer protein